MKLFSLDNIVFIKITDADFQSPLPYRKRRPDFLLCINVIEDLIIRQEICTGFFRELFKKLDAIRLPCIVGI